MNIISRENPILSSLLIDDANFFFQSLQLGVGVRKMMVQPHDLCQVQADEIRVRTQSVIIDTTTHARYNPPYGIWKRY